MFVFVTDVSAVVAVISVLRKQPPISLLTYWRMPSAAASAHVSYQLSIGALQASFVLN